jgi:mRNA-degrading endonuclease RelE of RelBE toxin-antitoxin system
VVVSDFGKHFEKRFRKIKDLSLKVRLKKQIVKVIDNPEIGKPMKHARKGTREIYISPFRLSYIYLKDKNKVVFLDFYHKDRQ